MKPENLKPQVIRRKEFAMHPTYNPKKTVFFFENEAPDWLCKGGLANSTMDMRWFWEANVLTLEKGESVRTDFNKITRIA
jgi:hypothetical protein